MQNRSRGFHTAKFSKPGSDRPDLRYGLPMRDVTEWGNRTGFKVFSEAKFVRALVVPGGATFTRKDIDEVYTDAAKRAKAKGLAWMKFVGGKWEGTIVKFFADSELAELSRLLVLGGEPHPNPLLKGEGGDVGLEGGIVFFVADNWEVSCKALGAVRSLVGVSMKLADPELIAWAWVVDFPFYEWSEEQNKIDFGHNPFSMPQGGLEALNSKDPLDVLAHQYDIIANGLELSSGAVRNYDPDIMYRAFEIAGYEKDIVDKKFGHMIKAFEFGAPPHCGFAPGVERLAMLLLGEPNIRAVVPFPKNQKAESRWSGVRARWMGSS